MSKYILVHKKPFWRLSGFKWGAAVSGGCDSMALCILLQHVKEKTCIFTVDHGLREKSKEEAEAVHRIVSEIGFQHKILSIKWPKGQVPTKSIENAARDQRYILLTRTCLENDIRVLFLGHHLDDQAETVLMRIIEKSGPDGLAGMQKIAQNPMIGKVMYAENVLFCRPFLDISKVVLKNICQTNGISWFEDLTNTLMHLSKRNVVRKLFQDPNQLPNALKPSNMLNIAQIMANKRIKTIEKVKLLLSKVKVTFFEATGSLEIVCSKGIYGEKISTLSKWMAHLISLVSPLPRQRITAIRRMTIDLFIKNSAKIKQYTVGGILIHAIWDSETLFIRLTRQPYSRETKKHSIISIQSTNLLNSQDTWILWDGRWWIRILSKNNTVKQFTVRPLTEYDIKPLFLMINAFDTEYKKTILHSLKMIKGYTKFTLPLVEFDTNIIGLPTLGIIFDQSVIIETRFKMDISCLPHRLHLTQPLKNGGSMLMGIFLRKKEGKVSEKAWNSKYLKKELHRNKGIDKRVEGSTKANCEESVAYTSDFLIGKTKRRLYSAEGVASLCKKRAKGSLLDNVEESEVVWIMEEEEGAKEQRKSSHESIPESSRKIHVKMKGGSSDDFSAYIDNSHIDQRLTQKNLVRHTSSDNTPETYAEVVDKKSGRRSHSLFSENIDHDNHHKSSTVEHVYNEEFDEIDEHYEDEYYNESDNHYAHTFGEEALDLFDYGSLPDSLHSALTGVFSGVASRFKSILNSLRQKDDPSTQLIALQGLSELLIVSTEDVLNSYFSPDLFIKELLSIMQTGASGFSDQNPEIVLLACRCLTNLMEALPSSISNVVYGGAIPILCQRLLEIQYIDLAEQALSTLEKISTEHPTAIVRDGGLTACLTYFDFFSTNLQRTAIITAANCCKNIPSDCFAIARDVISMLQNIIRNNDRKVLEQACLCVTRIVESFRHYPDKLEQLLSNDILQIIMSVLSNTSTNAISLSTYTQFLHVLAIASKSSPNLSIAILKLKVVETIYYILIGKFPNDVDSSEENITNTLYILIHRPREHIYETLNLMCELLPNLPRDDDIFNVCVGENFQLQISPSKLAKYKMLDERRLRLLENCQEEMKHFSRVLTPILVDIYHSAININVRQKVMIILLKIVINLKEDVLCESIKHSQFSFFLATVLSQHEYPSLILGALQLSELLLRRLSKIYLEMFVREGIIQSIYEISDFHLDNINLHINSNKTFSFHTSSVFSKMSISDFFMVLVKRAKSFISIYEKCEDRLLICEEASEVMSKLVFLAKRIKNHIKIRSTYRKLSRYFISNNSTITSYEILRSGLLTSLLESLSDSNIEVKQSARKAFLRSFLTSTHSTNLNSESVSDSPFFVLIQKLHESLSRNEDFEVVTVHGGSHEDFRKHPSAMLSKQLRLKLTAEEGSNVPRAYKNFIVSIYSVATFRTLDEYLRPRLISSQRSSVSRSNNSKTSTTPVTSNVATASTSSQIPLNKDKKMHRIKGKSFVIEKRKCSTRANLSEQTKSDLQTHKIKSSKSDISDDEMLEYANDYSGSDSADASQLFQIIDELKNEKSPPSNNDSQVDIESFNDSKANVKVKSKNQGEIQLEKNDLKSFTSSDKKLSYSSALQMKGDWNIIFEMDGKPINPDSTIYSAIHRYNIQNGRGSSDIWSFIYPIKFKKVLKSENHQTYEEESVKNINIEFETHDFSSYNANTILILKLLRVLHFLNANIRNILDFNELSNFINMTLSSSDFVNPKLTAKINRQLEEPLIVTSLCFPPWVQEFPRLFLFLFPFETRYLFLQSTFFGYLRSIARWQNTNGRDESHQNSRDDSRLVFGRLQRQKIRISRDHIMESTIKIMDLYGTSSFLLEIEYFDEVGTGLGPTLEFYSIASYEFTRKSLGLWRNVDNLSGNDFVFSPNGLFPMPLNSDFKDFDIEKKKIDLFKVMGKFIARSILDSRIVDISINPMFFRIALGVDDVKLSIESISEIDENLAKSLRFLMQFETAKRKILNKNICENEKEQLLKDVKVQDMSIEEFSLNFTLPGFPDIHLVNNGDDKTVTIHNIGEYINLIIDFTIGKGVREQINAFRDGFSSVLPYSSLTLFTPEELSMLFGQGKEDWSIETLTDSIKADHGYNMDSRSIQNFIDILSNMNTVERRQFLQFITGSPKLPIGGFKSLNPPLTVVCKTHEPPLTPNDYLPSVMACVNYLKLPDYTTKKIMKSKLFLAIKEGQGSFHLS
ncbi:hypothetical protein PMAC_001932 [Pneumocystis sp. 'macacae']|nr:hypothetical protein PMAC_001932 [Pneumocystis sp. 'macacae']